jgi:hypothetical protein
MPSNKFNARHGLSVGQVPIDVFSETGQLLGPAIPNLDASKITSGTLSEQRLPVFVTSVAGRSGAVTLTKADVGLSLVDNTADSSKFVASAATLTTARTIGGVSFNGSANINLPGVNTTGNQNTTGSAATLTTARTIGGVSFNGSANINLPGVNTTGNQNTTGSAATLTTARTIALTGDVTYTSGSFNGSANVTGTATLANSGVTAGTYTKVTVDAKGRATAGSFLTSTDVPALDTSKITTGTFSVERGGTGAATLAANSVILGNGTSALQTVAPGASGNTLVSNGTTWVSQAPAPSGVTTGKAIAMAIVFG